MKVLIMQHDAAILKTHMFPSLTGIIITVAHAIGAGALAFIGGELLIKSGVLAGGIALVATVLVEGLRTIVALRREKLNERKTRLDEFHAIEQRTEILHSQEREFLQEQITYLEALELANRERLHAALKEIQRCNAYIRTCVELGPVSPPPFQTKTYEEIVAPYPLPSPPR